MPYYIFEKLANNSTSVTHNPYKTDLFCLAMVFFDLFDGKNNITRVYERNGSFFADLQQLLEQTILDQSDENAKIFLLFLKNSILRAEETEILTPNEALIFLKNMQPLAPIWNSFFQSEKQQHIFNDSARFLVGADPHGTTSRHSDFIFLRDSQLKSASTSRIFIDKPPVEEEEHLCHKVDYSMAKNNEIKDFFKEIGIAMDDEYKEEE